MSDAIIEKRIAAYICKGCGIEDRVDCGQMEQIASREGKAHVVKQHEFLCNADGVKMIREDIENDGVTHVAVVACSRRSKTEAFHFEDVAVARANIREGVIWVRPDTDEARETTQEMADDYVRMVCHEMKSMKKPERSGEQEVVKSILIVGGGITGMTSAIEASKAGYKSTIVEKSGSLGGWAGKLYKRVPTNSPFNDPEDTGVAAMAAAVEADANITVQLNATVAETDGAPGRFEVQIATESGSVSAGTFGAIIQGSGFTPYDANKLTDFDYSNQPNVVTQTELEALAVEANGGPIKRPSDGKEVQSVVFIQCAGQRSDKEGELSYCSGHCCGTSIKQAMYFKDNNSDIDTVVMYTDLRTPGAGGEDFYRSGQKKGVLFTKGKASSVTADGDSLAVNFQDLILDEETALQADLVVLATGMVPNNGPDPYAPAPAEDEQVVDVDSILNLKYRQGTDLPHLSNGFTDSHFICFPYETRRTGIYSGGPSRRPMDTLQAREDATGAAMKAINAIENAGLGRAAHPRSGDLSFPKFRAEGCTQCKRCTVECPFGAINEDERGFPVYNEARCRRCGTCMGACPVRVISFENYSVQTVGDQIKNVDIPDEFDEKPRILVLACENDAYPALDMAAQNHIEYSAFARVIPVRCLGSTSVSWVTDSMNSGFDGVVMMGCQRGDDYQCHFVKGSELANERMSKVGDTLETLSLEKERVIVHEVAITDIHRAPQLIDDMAEVIEKVGMSPFKF